MSNPIKLSLAKPPLDELTRLFLSQISRPVEARFLNFALDSVRSRLIITPKDVADNGDVGIYSGTYNWTYKKADLRLAVPSSLKITSPYPLTFRTLQAYLLNRYQIFIEEGELSVNDNGPGLRMDDVINKSLTTGFTNLTLYATEASARFQKSSVLGLIVIRTGSPKPLRALLDTPHALDLNQLVGK